MLSNNQLKKLSRRIRYGQHSDQDLLLLTEYRDSFLPTLVHGLIELQAALEETPIPFLISGRPKRVKSIVRKLARGEVNNLATVADIAGVRVVVSSLDELGSVANALEKKFPVVAKKDYCDEPAGGYRALHLYTVFSSQHIEVQVRTIPQQVWATESETLGEHVKHGGGTREQREYLELLSKACASIDGGIDPSAINEISGLGNLRGPIHGRLPVISRHFSIAVEENAGQQFYTVVYDGLTNELLSIQPYLVSSADDAIEDYNYKARLLDENRYDVLMLNAKSERALKVTHPPFFPSL